MASWEFPCDGPIELSVGTAAGTVTLTAVPTQVATVEISRSGWGSDADLDAEITVDYDGGRLEISQQRISALRMRGHSFDVHVTVPTGSRCQVATAAASVTSQGELGALDVKTASGTVTADLVRGPATIATMSGAIRLGEVTGRASAKSASGRITLTTLAGDVEADSVSGTISIGTALAGVSAHTASGRVQIDNVSHGETKVNTVSGDITVGVAPGVGVFLDLGSLSGKVSSDLAPDDEAAGDTGLQLRGRSVSGAVRVTRAQQAPVAG